jgi:hypothetical protein
MSDDWYGKGVQKFLASMAIKRTRIPMTDIYEINASSPYEVCDLVMEKHPELKEMLNNSEIYLDWCLA